MQRSRKNPLQNLCFTSVSESLIFGGVNPCVVSARYAIGAWGTCTLRALVLQLICICKSDALVLHWMCQSVQALSTDEERREAVAKQLAAVGAELEKEFGGPQDVEGALLGTDVYVVQTRPQP